MSVGGEARSTTDCRLRLGDVSCFVAVGEGGVFEPRITMERALISMRPRGAIFIEYLASRSQAVHVTCCEARGSSP